MAPLQSTALPTELSAGPTSRLAFLISGVSSQYKNLQKLKYFSRLCLVCSPATCHSWRARLASSLLLLHRKKHIAIRLADKYLRRWKRTIIYHMIDDRFQDAMASQKATCRTKQDDEDQPRLPSSDDVSGIGIERICLSSAWMDVCRSSIACAYMYAEKEELRCSWHRLPPSNPSALINSHGRGRA